MAASRGFAVQTVDAERVQREFGVTGGPWLMIADPRGRVVYSGGYAPKRVESPRQAQDLTLLSRLRTGERLAAFAPFGCATSHWARQAADPLGLTRIDLP